MTSGAAIPAGRQTGPSLRQRRCVRHSEREAVARCPSCGGFYCRECVVEHDGVWLCASCLRKKSESIAPVRVRLWPGRAARLAACAASVLVAWLLFYGLGQGLVRIPPDVHEGTFWKKAAKQLNESAP